jgi:hypothetical protein
MRPLGKDPESEVKICIICSAVMVPDMLPDTFRCPACRFFASELPVTINQANRIDEDMREIALKSLRTDNFRRLLDYCSDLLPADGRLLDIGCAHGWFLDASRCRGIQAEGIEPDREMAARARAGGHNVIEGFFPDAMPAEAKYNAITFNDVLEHITGVETIVRRLPSFLEQGGLVIVNVPVSDGLIFRLSRQAARFGIRGPLARMWQRGLPSPHLSYFSASTLSRLFERAGFKLVRSGALVSISTRDLYRRIRYDRAVGPGKAAALYAAARGAKLIVGAFPSDIQYFVLRKAIDT